MRAAKRTDMHTAMKFADFKVCVAFRCKRKNKVCARCGMHTSKYLEVVHMFYTNI